MVCLFVVLASSNSDFALQSRLPVNSHMKPGVTDIVFPPSLEHTVTFRLLDLCVMNITSY